jgi:hypothetical protein
LLSRAAPIRDHGPDQRQKKQRRKGQEMRAEKSEHFERAKGERLVEAAAGAQVKERDPGVLRIPNDGRHQAKGESAEQKIQPATLELAAMPRN